MRPSPLASIKLNARVGESAAPPGVSHLARQVEATVPQVAPVTDRAIHLEESGRPLPKRSASARSGLASDCAGRLFPLSGKKSASFRFELGIAEFERREVFCSVTVVADDLHLAEQSKRRFEVGLSDVCRACSSR